MSPDVLWNEVNELRKRDKMRGLPSILSLFRNEFNKINKTGAECKILFIYIKVVLKSYFGVKTLWFCRMRLKRHS